MTMPYSAFNGMLPTNFNKQEDKEYFAVKEEIFGANLKEIKSANFLCLVEGVSSKDSHSSISEKQFVLSEKSKFHYIIKFNFRSQLDQKG